MRKLLVLILGALTIHSCQEKEGVHYADMIIHNGPILTMVDDRMTVQGIAVTDGVISAIGDSTSLSVYKGSKTIMKNLEGQTLLPGFIDAHSHVGIAMRTIGWADLNAPPVGNIRNIPQLLSALQDYVSHNDLNRDQWILGHGYDPDQLEERRHPSLSELSEAFPDNPVMILHVSGHMVSVNQKALDVAGITIETENPEGGVIVRDQLSNKPTGLLQEKAMYLILPKLPVPDIKDMIGLFDKVQDHYASHGITTAQDGLCDFKTFKFLQGLSAQDALKLDIEVLASYLEADAYKKENLLTYNQNGLRVTGMKIVSDGSPQGKTAYFRKPYLTNVPGCVHECRGVPTISPSNLKKVLADNYKNDLQTYIHANGDGAIDMVLDTHEHVTDSLSIATDIQRTVIIHSQFVGQDQLEKYKKYKFVPSFFSNHAYFWGDVHLDNLGEERASFLSPMNTAASLGITYTNHTDYTITPIDQLFLLWTAVNRTTRSGAILGPEERISPWQGLKAVTINSAYQHRVEDKKGSIEIGKLADFVILDNNPLEVDADAIRDINVVETIKEGETIYAYR